LLTRRAVHQSRRRLDRIVPVSLFGDVLRHEHARSQAPMPADCLPPPGHRRSRHVPLGDKQPCLGGALSSRAAADQDDFAFESIHCFSSCLRGRTFHGYGETPCNTPVISRRNAVLPYHWPTGTVATSVIATCDNSLAAFSCRRHPGGEPSRCQRARLGVVHQPNQPFAPRPVINGLVAGELAVAEEAKVWNTLQPLSHGLHARRRCTTVPQSVSCNSTFMRSPSARRR